MAQLGSDFLSTFPSQIDTIQVYRNGPSPAPDSDTRLDAQFANGVLSAIENIEHALGANPQGVYGSVAARLAQSIPGGGGVAALITFTNATTVAILGTVHAFGTASLLKQVYDNSTPAQALKPDSFMVDLTTYDATLGFAAPQSGFVALGSPTPQYRTTFVSATSLTILGSVHNLGTADLLWEVTDALSPAHELELNTFAVHPSTFDVTITFLTPQSGALILAVPSPGYTGAFTGQTTFTILGTTHQLGTRALLYKLYTTATPRMAFEEQALTVHPTSYDVTVTFLSAQTGRLVLGAAPSLSTQDFEIRDGGIVNSSATRVFSQTGDLVLQAGASNHISLLDSNGTAKAVLDTSTGRLGIGVTPTPAYQLQLSTDSAAKPGTSTWTVASDARLKDVLRPYTDGLRSLLQIDPVWYKYNGKAGLPGGKRSPEQIGVIAQALQPIAPYLVSSHKGKLQVDDTEETDILGYEGHALQFMLLNGMKELHARLVVLEEECQALRAQLAASEEARHLPPPDEPLP